MRHLLNPGSSGRKPSATTLIVQGRWRRWQRCGRCCRRSCGRAPCSSTASGATSSRRCRYGCHLAPSVSFPSLTNPAEITCVRKRFCVMEGGGPCPAGWLPARAVLPGRRLASRPGGTPGHASRRTAALPRMLAHWPAVPHLVSSWTRSPYNSTCVVLQQHCCRMLLACRIRKDEVCSIAAVPLVLGQPVV